MRYLLVWRIPEPLASRHRALVEAVAERFALPDVRDEGLPAHCTLKYWFEADDARFADVIASLEQLAPSLAPAPVTVGGADGFEDGGRVIFLHVAHDERVRVIQRALDDAARALPWMSRHPYDGPELHLHATVCWGVPPERVAEVRAFVDASLPERFELAVDNLTLLRPGGDVAWEMRLGA